MKKYLKWYLISCVIPCVFTCGWAREKETDENQRWWSEFACVMGQFTMIAAIIFCYCMWWQYID